MPPEPPKPASALSPSKKMKEEQPEMTSDLCPPASTSNLPLTSDDKKEEQKIKAEVVPDLCGMRNVRMMNAILPTLIMTNIMLKMNK